MKVVNGKETKVRFTPMKKIKNVELIIQVNLLQELSQGITRYPTPALSQVWRCEGFHRVLNVLFSN